MEFLSGTLFGFFLVLTRLGAFFATAPVFSWRVLPVPTRTAIAVVLSVFFSALVPVSPAIAGDLPLLERVLLLAQEAIYGLSLGLVAYCLFAVVQQAGRFVERQMALNMANLFDPFSGEQARPLGMLLEILFILLLFSTDGHHLLLKILARSFDRYPLGAGPAIGPLTESIILAGSTMFLLALQMAAPMLAAFLLLMVVLAFLARIAPETNVLFLSLPLRVGLGLLLIGFFIPYLNGYLQQFAAWLNRLLPL